MGTVKKPKARQPRHNSLVSARAKKSLDGTPQAEAYLHHDEAVLRPEAGTQAQFKKRRPPRKYRYDSSLSPALEWDDQNGARALGEWLIAVIEEAGALPPPQKFPEPRRYGEVVVTGLKDALVELRKVSRPFLNWAGKAERLSFEVPTLPLFVHERLSTKAILETLKAHERDRQMELQLFGDPQLSLAQQLEAYEHTGGWVNRLILGDSLVVMTSLLEYEGLGGQFQMIYIDPPYGVRFGSNFQPFVRRRDVKDGSDDDLTREPEMVKAYRDTWEVGIHSYLTYLRDRLLVARELLTRSGSVFVQISDENVHHVRELMDEIFGSDNFVGAIGFVKTSGLAAAQAVAAAFDYLLWYARDRQEIKFHQLFFPRDTRDLGMYAYAELSDRTRRRLTTEEREGLSSLPEGGRVFRLDNLTKPGPGSKYEFAFDGRVYEPGNRWWGTTKAGMERLAKARRLSPSGRTLAFIRYWDDFAWRPITNLWTDTATGGFAEDKLYVVQTGIKILQRCILMTTDPGDLVLDPTCGSGTTAYVAEQWGRRWITVDISRIPLALTRQRLLTATFPYYELHDKQRGPALGFVYQRRQNRRGEEVGGIVPHVMLESIANEEPPREEVLVDRPEANSKITRVAGPFCVEATIPTPLNGDTESGSPRGAEGSFADRLLEVLRRNPVLHLGGNRTIALADVRQPAKSLTISAEAALESNRGTVALVFGPENSAISERLVYEGAREAHARNYSQLIVIGFAIEASARELVEKCADLIGIPATYVQATPDLVMGDLLKTMRSSEIFSVTGLPDVALKRLPAVEKGGPERYQVELRGLDVFDPVEMGAAHRAGSDVPAWFLDTDYNELCFLVSQAFFPRTSAWENLSKALKGSYEPSVWEHLAGTTSTPFVAGERRRIAVKVIDDRGNELLIVKGLDEAR